MKIALRWTYRTPSALDLQLRWPWTWIPAQLFWRLHSRRFTQCPERRGVIAGDRSSAVLSQYRPAGLCEHTCAVLHCSDSFTGRGLSSACHCSSKHILCLKFLFLLLSSKRETWNWSTKTPDRPRSRVFVTQFRIIVIQDFPGGRCSGGWLCGWCYPLRVTLCENLP